MIARRLLAASMVVAILAGAGSACSRKVARRSRDLPAGDAVWFEDRAGAAAPDAEALLARGGFASVFVPAARVAREDGWTAQEFEPPARPFARLSVFLVVGADASARSSFSVPGRLASAEEPLWQAVKAALRDGGRYGRIAGVHLDLPWTTATAPAYATVVSGLRARLAPSMPLTVTLRLRPSEPEREKIATLASAADGFLAMVFGEGDLADPAGTDALGRPWWAGYAPAARGRWTGPDGEAHEGLPESVLASLTDDSRIDFAHELTLKEESNSGFVLRPREPVSIGGRSFPAGSRILFRQPTETDLVYRLGADLAGRRFVRGRVVAIAGTSESDRIFTLGALDEILAGGSLVPDLSVSIETGKRFIRVAAENSTPQASVVSRTTNWVELDLPSAGVVDVQSGGFDRYEVFGPDGRPVALSRATRIRFYETLVGPFEKIAPAKITLRRAPPPDCCATRIHLLAAAGKEVAR